MAGPNAMAWACEQSRIGAENGAERAEKMSEREHSSERVWKKSAGAGAGGHKAGDGAVSGLNWLLKSCSKVILTYSNFIRLFYPH